MSYYREIIEIYRREEKIWRQRVRCWWLKEGNANMAFYDKTTSMWMRLNTVINVVTNEGNIEEEDHIHAHFFNHFGCIFGYKNNLKVKMSGKSWSKNLDLSILKVDFDEEEIRKAIWHLGADKAPWFDGFLSFFFRRFCNELKQDMI